MAKTSIRLGVAVFSLAAISSSQTQAATAFVGPMPVTTVSQTQLNSSTRVITATDGITTIVTTITPAGTYTTVTPVYTPVPVVTTAPVMVIASPAPVTTTAPVVVIASPAPVVVASPSPIVQETCTFVTANDIDDFKRGVEEYDEENPTLAAMPGYTQQATMSASSVCRPDPASGWGVSCTP